MRDCRLLGYAKQMRSEMTPAEQRLWYALRAKRFDGIKFRRQTVLGSCIVDFASRSQMLVIEVDGDTHAGRERYDAARERALAAMGFRVLRFTNADVMGNFEAVLGVIGDAVRQPPLLGPLP